MSYCWRGDEKFDKNDEDESGISIEINFIIRRGECVLSKMYFSSLPVFLSRTYGYFYKSIPKGKRKVLGNKCEMINSRLPNMYSLEVVDPWDQGIYYVYKSQTKLNYTRETGVNRIKI